MAIVLHSGSLTWQQAITGAGLARHKYPWFASNLVTPLGAGTALVARRRPTQPRTLYPTDGARSVACSCVTNTPR